MQNRGILTLAIILITSGVMLLLSSIFKINSGAICFPTLLILLGLWAIFRPRLGEENSNIEFNLFGDLRRQPNGILQSKEYWLFVGDLDLDLTFAELPEGETTIRVIGFVGDLNFIVPASAAVSMTAGAIAVDARIDGQKQEGVFTPVKYETQGYAQAGQRLRLDISMFVADVDLRSL
jgi:predicted membrane protein